MSRGARADGWRRDEFDRFMEAQERSSSAANPTPPWRRGYSPYASQLRFHESEARFKGFSGPVGSGKSVALVAEALRLAYDNPGLPGLIGAPTYPMLRDVTRAAFLAMVERAGVPYVFRRTDNEVILLDTQSVVRFRSLDHPERLVGANLAWFGVDELTYCKRDAWNRLEARLRHPAATRLCGFAAWTPKGFDWVYESFIGPNKTAGYDAVLAAPGENVALPADFYDRLRASYDERFYQQEALGQYLALFAGRVYYAFDRAQNVAPLGFDPALPLIWALDFNVNPMASVIAQERAGTVAVLQEIVLPNSNTPEACRIFGERIARYSGMARGGLRVLVYGDPAGSQRSHAGKSDWEIVRSELSRSGIEHHLLVAPKAPAIRDRVNAVNSMLCAADGRRRLMIDPSCRELIADLEQVAWKVDAAGNSIGDLDKSNPKRTHVSDALGYYIEKEHGLKRYGGPRSGVIA